MIELLKGKCLKYELVGSRVTCDPAPTSTDQDVLVLADVDQWAAHLAPLLATEGFEKGGSDCGDVMGYMAQVPLSFQSFTLGDLNLIITFDPEFYRRFMAATGVAKHLNLLDKGDRVMLFQAVLYGNEPFPKLEPPPEPAPFKEYMRAWWVCSKGHGSGCVEAMNETEARAIALEKMGGEILACDQLPYPASPRIHTARHDFPSFCFEPHKCKGHSSCPQRHSCTE